MRDVYLNYLSALTNRYEGMSQEEKEHLCALIMYEATKRFVAGGSAEDRAKYSLIVAAAEAQGDREEEVFGDCLCGLIVV